MKKSCFLLALLLGFAVPRVSAINVSEGFDFANSAGAATTFPLDLGVNTFSGTVSPFTDIEDHFKVSVPAGMLISGASKTWPGAAAGAVTFNGEVLISPPDFGSFTSGFPLAAGVYSGSATYGIGISSAAWSVTIIVVAEYAVTVTTNSITVTDIAGNGDTLDITEPSPGQIRFAAGTRTFSVNGGGIITGNSGDLSLTDINSVTVNAGAGNNTINVAGFPGTSFPSLTINGGTGNDTVNFNGDITFAALNDLDVNLQDDGGSPGVDTVNVTAGANLNTSLFGTITMKCSRNVSLATGASLGTGLLAPLTVEANQQEPATAGNFVGVNLDGATLYCAGFAEGSTPLTVKGRGGNDAAGAQIGVNVSGGGRIIGGTTTTVQVIGSGGAGGGQVNRGVTITGADSLIEGPIVTVTGQGGGIPASDFNIGVTVLSGGKINGNQVSVNGTGGLGGFFNQGVELGNASITCGGNSGITVNAIPGSGSSVGFFMASSAVLSATNSSLTIYSDSMSWDGTSSISAGNTVTLLTYAVSTLIDLGGADSAGTLGLTDAELDRVTSPNLVVAGAGDITISSGISPAGVQNLTLSTSPASSIRAAAAGVDVTLPSTLRLGAPLAMPITGVAADTGYPQLKVAGGVNLNNATLNLAGTTFSGAEGMTFRLVDNDGSDPIIGTFNDLPEGAYLAWPGSLAFNARISYVGGDGNDVVLTLVSALTVTTTSNSGAGSLRSALASASATNIADTITFDPALAGQTITLTNEIIINDTNGVTIDATSLTNGLTISGGNTTRIFTVPTGSSLTLQGLTLSDGKGNGYAGAIYNQGTLTLAQCTLSGNSATIFGGAIVNRAALTMTNCTLSGNSALAGGAINNDGSTATLTHCTLAFNHSTGLISDADGGGAIYNYSATLFLNGCILAGNTSATPLGPDFWMESGTLTAVNCLIGDGTSSSMTNGVNGNLVGHSFVPIDARLLPLGNYGGLTQTMPPRPDSPAVDAAPGSTVFIDQRGVGRPLNGDLTGPAVRDIGAVEFNNFMGVTTTADELDSPAGVKVSLREALRDATEGALVYFSPADFYPASNTIALASGELLPAQGVVINADSVGGVTINGNNSSRILSITENQVDITAASGTTATQSSDYGNDYLAGDGIDGNTGNFTHTSGVEPDPSWTADFHRDVFMTRMEIVNRSGCCEQRLRDITIVLLDASDAILYTSPVLNPSNVLSGPSSLFVSLPGALAVRKVQVRRDSSSAVGDDRVLAIAELKVFNLPGISLQGLTLTGGNGNGAAQSGKGGAILNSDALTLTRCTLFGNHASDNGGAIWNGGTAMFVQCTLSSNHSAIFGGAVENLGIATLTHCTLSGNNAQSGGAIDNYQATLTLSNCIVAGNTATNAGADIINDNATINFAGSNIVQSLGTFGSFTNNGPAPINANPLLAPLGNYGGSTMTMALMPGSPARNAASGSTLTTDQRGFSTVGVPDIGAYEAGSLGNYNSFAWEFFPANASVVDRDRNTDYDGDGRVNGFEYGALSDPLVSDSVPVFTFTLNAAGTVATNSFYYRVLAKDLNYQLFRTTNLSSGWSLIYELDLAIPQLTRLDPNLTLNNDLFTQRIADPSIGVQPQTFYRLQITIAP